MHHAVLGPVLLGTLAGAAREHGVCRMYFCTEHVPLPVRDAQVFVVLGEETQHGHVALLCCVMAAGPPLAVPRTQASHESEDMRVPTEAG